MNKACDMQMTTGDLESLSPGHSFEKEGDESSQLAGWEPGSVVTEAFCILKGINEGD